MVWTREQMAQRAARELQDGFYVNLGIGIPTLVANYIPPGIDVALHSENGMLGVGPFPFEGEEDPDLINAGKQTVTELARTSYFDSATSFAMIRGGHIDIALLGALQVAENGDIANWAVPGKMVNGPGGAMDLVAGVRRVVAIMEQMAKGGESKLVRQCSLPLTGKHCVHRVITDYGVYDIAGASEGLRGAQNEPQRKSGGFILRELAAGVSVEEAKKNTAADLQIALSK